MNLIVQSQHRSSALADRKLASLRRQYRPRKVELLSRRNAKGHYSGRGQFYVWEVSEDKPGERMELVLHFDYGSSKARDLLRFQIHVTTPGSVDDEEAIDAIRAHYHDGEKFPKGWREKIIYWGHVRPGYEGDVDYEFDKKDDRQKYLRSLTIEAGEGQVSRRRAIKKNRRTRKGKTK